MRPPAYLAKSSRKVVIRSSCNLRHSRGSPPLDVGRDDRRHTPDHHEPVEPGGRRLMACWGELVTRRPRRERLQQSILPMRLEELGKAHGLKVQVADAAHRHPSGRVRESEIEQAPGSVTTARPGSCSANQRKLASTSRPAWISSRQQEKLPREDVAAEGQGQLAEDLARVVALKPARSERLLLEVDLDQVEAASESEVADEPGLAHLACAADDQRLSSVTLQPCRQLGTRCSFHGWKLPKQRVVCRQCFQ